MSGDNDDDHNEEGDDADDGLLMSPLNLGGSEKAHDGQLWPQGHLLVQSQILCLPKDK